MKILYLFSFVALSFIPLISGQPYYVTPGATGTGTIGSPFGNISIAVSTATTGQTIYLNSGTYTGTPNININVGGKALTFIGQGWRTTIIDCNQFALSAFVAQVAGATISISGVSIVNCQRSAISLRNAGVTHSVSNCYFSGHQNALYNGGGIGVSLGSAIINNCTFERIQQTAIWSDTGNITVLNSRFSFNTPYLPSQGGAIAFTGAGSGVVSNSIFIGNENAISQGTGSLVLTSNRFFNNSYTFTVQCANPSFVTSSGNSFCGVNGLANSCGGLTGYSTYYDGCSVCKGMNEYKDCNGICWGPNSNCPPQQTVNVSPGGNIQSAIDSINTYRGQVILAKGTYTGVGNRNLNFGGKAVVIKSKYSDPLDVTIDCQGAVGISGFIVNQRESFDTLIEGITIRNCSGSAILMSGNSGLTLSRTIITANYRSSVPGGAAVRMTDSFIYIQNSSITNNRAVQPGGAIYLTRTASPSISWAGIYETQFIDNQCDSSGGAIQVDTPNGIEIRDSYFIRNTASSTDTGGAINTRMNPGSVLVISGTTFFNNSYLQPLGQKEVLYCGAIANLSTVTFDVNTGNTFCSDSNSNVINCGGFNSGFTAVVDICGVCNGAGRNLDCNGTCFGSNIADGAGGCCRRSDSDCNGRCSRDSTDSYPSSITGLPVCCLNTSIYKDTNGDNVCCMLPETPDVCGICGGNGQCCPVQCKNGGTCLGYSCQCVNGWSGSDCSVNGVGCPQGCINGACVAPYQCQCFDSGDQSVNCGGSEQCGTITCVNGGVCANSTTETCNCTVNWYGRNCTTPVCSPQCQNGGKCLFPYYCECQQGWTDNICSTYYCSPSCLNGGTCTGPGTCNCPTGYSGPRCNEYSIQEGESESIASIVMATVTILFIALLL